MYGATGLMWKVNRGDFLKVMETLNTLLATSAPFPLPKWAEKGHV